MTYGRTWANTIGQVLEIIGWLILLGVSIWRFILWRRRRRLAGAGGSGVMPLDEFTGQYLEGRDQHYDSEAGLWVLNEPVGKTAAGDLEPTAEDEGAGYDVDAGSALARYEAGGQGWSAPDDAAQAEDTVEADDWTGEYLPDESPLDDDLPSVDPAEDLLRLEEDS
jgi:hypothetical protein